MRILKLDEKHCHRIGMYKFARYRIIPLRCLESTLQPTRPRIVSIVTRNITRPQHPKTYKCIVHAPSPNKEASGKICVKAINQSISAYIISLVLQQDATSQASGIRPCPNHPFLCYRWCTSLWANPLTPYFRVGDGLIRDRSAERLLSCAQLIEYKFRFLQAWVTISIY